MKAEVWFGPGRVNEWITGLAKSKIVCLDNNITAFALRDDAHPDDSEKAIKARALLRYLDDQEKIIFLPTPVNTECLWPVAVHVRERELNVINKLMIGAFDLAASAKCAEMMHAITPVGKEFKEDRGITKAQMKFDYMIAAIGIVNEAECIYSEDEGLKKFCDGHIDVRPIPPDIPTQGKLFPDKWWLNNLRVHIYGMIQAGPGLGAFGFFLGTGDGVDILWGLRTTPPTNVRPVVDSSFGSCRRLGLKGFWNGFVF